LHLLSSRMLSIVPLLFGIIAPQALASSIVPFGAFRQLLTRQDTGFDPSTIPSQCQSRCRVIVNSILSCEAETVPPLDCGCSRTEESGFVDCLDCIIALAPTQEIINIAQTAVNNYILDCAQVGVSLPPATVNGASPPKTSSRAVSVTGFNTISQVTITHNPTPFPSPTAILPSINSGGNNPDPSGSGNSPLGGTTGRNGASRSSIEGGIAGITALAAAVCVVLF